MRALVISDTHFGAWTGRDLLREDFFLERLAPALEGVDEVILRWWSWLPARKTKRLPGSFAAISPSSPEEARYAWPGTAIVIDDSEPQPRLLEFLADLNPLAGGPGLPKAPA